MSATTASKGKAKARPAPARAFDLSWLLDRPRPADIDTRENYVVRLRSSRLPVVIHDKAEHEAALAAVAPLWGREHSMTADQADWFALVTDLIADYEDRTGKKAKPLPLAKHLAVLLDLEPSMGSKLLNGTRQLTAAHIRALAAHFALPAEYFLQAS